MGLRYRIAISKHGQVVNFSRLAILKSKDYEAHKLESEVDRILILAPS